MAVQFGIAMFSATLRSRAATCVFELVLGVLCLGSGGAELVAAGLPAGVTAEWDLAKAYREETPSRGRICINGLWRWQPAIEAVVPAGNWGFFKVPGPWPG